MSKTTQNTKNETVTTVPTNVRATSEVQILDDGTIFRQLGDIQIRVTPDQTFRQSYASGAVVQVQPNADLWTKFPNGVDVNVNPQGAFTAKLPQGLQIDVHGNEFRLQFADGATIAFNEAGFTK